MGILKDSTGKGKYPVGPFDQGIQIHYFVKSNITIFFKKNANLQLKVIHSKRNISKSTQILSAKLFFLNV